MKRRLIAGTFAAAMWTLALATPALAHGDHDARPLARDLVAGPYVISLWQVYPDAGVAMTPHLIVMFDGATAAPTAAVVTVAVNATPMEVTALDHDRQRVGNDRRPRRGGSGGCHASPMARRRGISIRSSSPPAPTSMLPMQELIYASIFLTLGTAVWLAGRTARAWRRPAVQAS